MVSGDPAAIFGTTFRAVGSFQSAVGLASFATPAAVFGLVMGLRNQEDRLLGFFVAAVGLVAVLGSYVRISLLAIVVAAAAGVFLTRARSTRGSTARSIGSAVAIGSVVIGLAAVASFSVPYAKSRFDTLLDPGSDASLQIRFDTWHHALDEFSANPLGRGLGQVGHATELNGSHALITDNSFLKVLVEQGILGFPVYVFALLGLVAVAGSRLSRAPPPQRVIGGAALAGFIAWLLLGLAGEYIEQPGKALAWILLGVAIGQVFAERPPVRVAPPDPRLGRERLSRRSARMRWAAIVALGVVTVVLAMVNGSRHSTYTASVEAAPSHSAALGQSADMRKWRRLARDPGVAFVTRTLLPTDSSYDWISRIRLKQDSRSPFSFAIVAPANTPARARLLASSFGVNLAGSVARDLHEDPSRLLQLGPATSQGQPMTRVDNAVDSLPGPFPPRPSTLWIVAVGLLACGAVYVLWSVVLFEPRVRSFPANAMSRITSRAGPGAWPLVIACAAAAVLLLALTSGLTFFNDEWDVILNRPGWSPHSLLRPHNEHIYLGPVLIYKVLLATLGLRSQAPYEVVNILLVLCVAVLMFVYTRRRLGPWLALLAACVLLFLGSAQEDLVWPGGISFVGALAGGLGALVMLDRRDAASRWWVAVLLVVSISFSTLGVMFALGAGLELWLRDRKWASLKPALIPLLLYALWYLAYGHEASSAASLQNVLAAPRYVAEAVASSLAGALGLYGDDPLLWGRPLAIAATIGAIALASRDRGVDSPVLGSAGDRWELLDFFRSQRDTRTRANAEPLPVDRRGPGHVDRSRAVARSPSFARRPGSRGGHRRGGHLVEPDLAEGWRRLL